MTKTSFFSVAGGCVSKGGSTSWKGGRKGGGEGRRTLTRPRQAGRVDGRTLSKNLEPDLAGALKVGGRLAVGDLGHVELERARVANVRVDGEADLGAGRHGVRFGRVVDAAVGPAADVVGRDVRDGAVAVVVGRHAHILPVFGRVAVGDERGECVCC